MLKKAPIKFKPYLKTVIWGGDKICGYKGIEQPEPKIGESWEISAIPGHESIVVEGDYLGMNLSDLSEKFGEELLGDRVFKKYKGKFPLLIKFIDANDNLSVQVHPNDELAQERHQCQGKSEMWYIIDSHDNAKIYSGLRRLLSPDEYERKVADNSFMDVIATHDCREGDVFFLPAGRVHAIGAGAFLAEIQESSDITYRIYDYNRKDKDGKYRELHTELAKEAIDYKVYSDYKNPRVPDDVDDIEIANCEHFQTRRIILQGEKDFLHDASSFTVVMCIKGEATLIHDEGETKISQGETILLPAILTRFKMAGNATLLLSRS